MFCVGWLTCWYTVSSVVLIHHNFDLSTAYLSVFWGAIKNWGLWRKWLSNFWKGIIMPRKNSFVREIRAWPLAKIHRVRLPRALFFLFDNKVNLGVKQTFDSLMSDIAYKSAHEVINSKTNDIKMATSLTNHLNKSRILSSFNRGMTPVAWILKKHSPFNPNFANVKSVDIIYS